MSYPKLKTDYKEFEIVGGEEKKYSLASQGNGRYAFTDKTEYAKDSRGNVIGDYIVAANVNTTHMYINALASEWSSWVTVSIATPLPHNLKDAQHGGNKIYEIVNLDGNEVELIDRTTYTQVGSTYDAATINKANRLLNNMSEQYEINANRIKALLQEKGAKSTSDILAAFDQMIAHQRNLGMAAGEKYVKNHPDNCGLALYSEYTDCVTQNENINRTVSDVKTDIHTCQSEFTTNESVYVTTNYNNALDYADEITAGDTRSRANRSVQDSIQATDETYSKERAYCVSCYDYYKESWLKSLEML